jgi:hypothetical protein
MHPSGIPDITGLLCGRMQLQRMAQIGPDAACSAPYRGPDLGSSGDAWRLMIILGLARLSAGHYYIRLSTLNAQ